jgi:hypothetical protein
MFDPGERQKEIEKHLLKLVPSNEAVTVQIKPSKGCLNLHKYVYVFNYEENNYIKFVKKKIDRGLLRTSSFANIPLVCGQNRLNFGPWVPRLYLIYIET